MCVKTKFRGTHKIEQNYAILRKWKLIMIS